MVMSVMWTQGRRRVGGGRGLGRERGSGNERVKGDREEDCEEERGR